MGPNQDNQIVNVTPNVTSTPMDNTGIINNNTNETGNNVVFQDQPKKKSHAMLYGMIFLAILAAGGIGFGVWALLDGNTQLKKKDDQISDLRSQLAEATQPVVEEDTTVVEDNVESGNSDTIDNNKRNCDGTYYGELINEQNGISSELKYKYVLGKDGSFTADYGGVSGKNGTYIINDNTISFTGQREIGGPKDQVPSYITEDAIVADDCSYIKLNYNGSYSYQLDRQ